MTSSFDALRYQRALERWRVLAEQRLEHMTVLYESGRWRRYFSEEQFIGVIRETRTAVEAWRRIVPEQERVAQLFAMADERSPVATEPQLPAFAAADQRPLVVPERPPIFAMVDERPVVVSEPEPPAFAMADERTLVVAEPSPPPFATPLPEIRLSIG